jgi:CBS domain-containing protein
MRIETDHIGMVSARPVVVIDEDATLRDLAVLLDQESIGVAVICGPRSSVLVSERDVVRALAEGANPDRERVGNVATLDVEVIDYREPIVAAAHKMLDNEVRHLPVVRDGKVVGVASIRDVLSALIGAQ